MKHNYCTETKNVKKEMTLATAACVCSFVGGVAAGVGITLNRDTIKEKLDGIFHKEDPESEEDEEEVLEKYSDFLEA